MPEPQLNGVHSMVGYGNTGPIAGVDLALTVDIVLVLSRPCGEQTT